MKAGVKLSLAPGDKFYLGNVLAFSPCKLQQNFSSDRRGFKDCSSPLNRLSVCPAWRQEGVMRLMAAGLPKEGLFLTSVEAS